MFWCCVELQFGVLGGVFEGFSLLICFGALVVVRMTCVCCCVYL